MQGQVASGANQGRSVLFETDVASFVADEHLREEVFGASSLLVRCRDVQDMRALLDDLEGQLTITLQVEDEDIEDVRALLPVLERKAGRLLVNGWPTGVEVSHAMVMGARSRPHRTGARLRSARSPSAVSCGPSATRTSRLRCCPRQCGTATRSASGGR